MLQQRAVITNSSDTSSGPAEGVRGAGKRILLVDDDDALRQMTARILRRDGYHVVEAANGEDGLRHWNEDPGSLDMLITDVVMPKLGGLELARCLRSSRAGIPVMYISGYAEEAIGPDARQTASTWLGKPFSPRTLLLEVRNLFDAAAATAPAP